MNKYKGYKIPLSKTMTNRQFELYCLSQEEYDMANRKYPYQGEFCDCSDAEEMCDGDCDNCLFENEQYELFEEWISNKYRQEKLERILK